MKRGRVAIQVVDGFNLLEAIYTQFRGQFIETLKYDSPFNLIGVNKAWHRFFSELDEEEAWDDRLKRWKLSLCIDSPTELERMHFHDRDRHIYMNEALHRYIIIFWKKETRSFQIIYSRNKSHPFKHKGLMSVTTHINTMLFPEFDQDVVIEKMRSSPWWHRSKYYPMTPNEIKHEWKMRGIKGTANHLNLENYFNGRPYDATTKEFALFQKSLVHLEDVLPYRSEEFVFDLPMLICGAIDMLFMPKKESERFDKDGNRILDIVDWKFTEKIEFENRYEKGISSLTKDVDNCNTAHFEYQLRYYRAILERNYKVRVRHMKIFALHCNQTEPIIVDVGCKPIDVAKLIRFRRAELAQQIEK